LERAYSGIPSARERLTDNGAIFSADGNSITGFGVQLNEVVITGKGDRNNWDSFRANIGSILDAQDGIINEINGSNLRPVDNVGRPGFLKGENPDWWYSDYKGTLAQYNAEFGTNYGGDNYYNDWYYETYYRPARSAMIGSMHRATGKAAEYLSYILPTAPPGIGALANASKISITSRIAFWSGKGTEALAISKGFNVLGSRLSGRILKSITARLDYYPGSTAYKLWGNVSRFYARRASGPVHVFQNAASGTGVNSIWARYEYPALIQNPNVQNIIFHY